MNPIIFKAYTPKLYAKYFIYAIGEKFSNFLPTILPQVLIKKVSCKTNIELPNRENICYNERIFFELLSAQ